MRDNLVDPVRHVPARGEAIQAHGHVLAGDTQEDTGFQFPYFQGWFRKEDPDAPAATPTARAMKGGRGPLFTSQNSLRIKLDELRCWHWRVLGFGEKALAYTIRYRMSTFFVASPS